MFIGIIISTALNIFIMPPDYTDSLKDKIGILSEKFGKRTAPLSRTCCTRKTEKEMIKRKRQIIRDELDETRELYNLLNEDISSRDKPALQGFKRSINAIQSNLDRLMAIHRSIVFMPDSEAYLGIRKELYEYLDDLLTLHRKIYDRIISGGEFCYPENNDFTASSENLRKNIVWLIKETDDEAVFEFYNIFFEGMRIHEKLNQLLEEFDLPGETVRAS